MKNKIRFKKEPNETGLASVCAGDPDIKIKINGKVCGYISHPSWRSQDGSVRIRLSIIKENIMEDGNANCIWKWITLKYIPESDEQAKQFLKENVDNIVNKYNLYYFED